jgi:hypothetical protein
VRHPRFVEPNVGIFGRLAALYPGPTLNLSFPLSTNVRTELSNRLTRSLSKPLKILSRRIT